jgi:tripartite-type tricarboxylate transporter receptor subunit TctC
MASSFDRRRFGSLLLAGAALPGAAAAQAPISRPVTLICPFAAGGSTDVLSRLVAKRFTERTGLSMVVENVGGAGGVVGAGRVARAEPDGATILMATVATHALNPIMMKEKPYDPEKDFTPISLLATVPNVLLVTPKLPAKDVKELVALLKSEDGRYTYASSGVGSPLHLAGELFKTMTGARMEHAPYRGGGPAMTDLIGGQVQLMFDVLSGAAPFVRSGQVRALAVTTKERSPAFPDLPTVAEAGVPGYEIYTWNAIFAPPKLPAPLRDFFASEMRAIVAETAMQERMRELSAVPVGSSPEALAELVRSETAKWEPVITATGMKQV